MFFRGTTSVSSQSPAFHRCMSARVHISTALASKMGKRRFVLQVPVSLKKTEQKAEGMKKKDRGRTSLKMSIGDHVFLYICHFFSKQSIIFTMLRSVAVSSPIGRNGRMEKMMFIHRRIHGSSAEIL
jgi:hypothetical protein